MRQDARKKEKGEKTELRGGRSLASDEIYEACRRISEKRREERSETVNDPVRKLRKIRGFGEGQRRRGWIDEVTEKIREMERNSRQRTVVFASKLVRVCACVCVCARMRVMQTIRIETFNFKSGTVSNKGKLKMELICP